MKKYSANLLTQEILNEFSAAQILQIARHPHRPRTLDYIEAISDEWLELHGDRCGSDDRAIVGGLAKVQGQKVLILGHQKRAKIPKIILFEILVWLALEDIVKRYD